MTEPTDPQPDPLADARATNQRLNLRAQRLESELATYRRAVAEWEISDQRTYVPLRTLGAIAKAAGLAVPERWELHYQRVERAEAALADALAAAPVPPSAPTDRAEPRERIAAAMRSHYLCTSRDEADADGNSPCRCGDWHEPGPMGSDEEDWDSHMADVALAELRRLAVEAPAPSRAGGETRRCVCGAPVEWMDVDVAYGSGWIHSPGSDTPCLDARCAAVSQPGKEA